MLNNCVVIRSDIKKEARTNANVPVSQNSYSRSVASIKVYKNDNSSNGTYRVLNRCIRRVTLYSFQKRLRTQIVAPSTQLSGEDAEDPSMTYILTAGACYAPDI